MFRKVKTIVLAIALAFGGLSALPSGAAADSYLGLGGGTGPKLDFRVGPEKNKRFQRREMRQMRERNRQRYERNRFERPRFERDRRRQPDLRQRRQPRRR